MIKKSWQESNTIALKKATELYLDGSFSEAIKRLTKYINSGRILEKRDLIDAYQIRGWIYRQLGEFELAIEDLKLGHSIALQSNFFIKSIKSLILLGDVYSYLIDRTNSLDACYSAQYFLNKNRVNPTDLEYSMLYATFGEIYRRFDQFDDAIEQYNNALQLLEKHQNAEWLSIVRCGRGTVFYKIRETTSALDDLNWVVSKGVNYLKPRALHYQAKVFWVMGELELAIDLLQKSRIQNEDIFYNYRSFSDILDLYWELGKYSDWKIFYNALLKDYSERKDIDSQRLFGSCLRKLGDLAICAGDNQIALEFYKRAFPIISEYEVHHSLTVWQQLLKTESRIKKVLSPIVLVDLGNNLIKFWDSNSVLNAKSPAVLALFYSWTK